MAKYQQERDIIKGYIEKRLQSKLEKDQKDLRILSEGDLQSCVYYHLRKFSEKKLSKYWYMTNKLAMGTQNVDKMFPDIVIMRMRDGGRSKPIFLIELKEQGEYGPGPVKDDLKKIKLAFKKWDDLVQAYFILAAPDEKNDSKKLKEEMETVRDKIKVKKVFLISVNVFHKMKGPEPEKWKEKYKRLKKLRQK